MNLWFLASFIVFALLVSHNVRKSAKNSKRQNEDFWAREHKANSVRRKSLDGLNYIHIPLEAFPTHLLNEDAAVMECISIIESLTSLKVVNLTGWSNTDLKLEYGTACITELSEYDQNYTLLVRTLQKWADALIKAGCEKEASTLMEFAISTSTDISQTYYQLADYWASMGEYDQIQRLIRTAEGLRSSTKTVILRRLKEKYGRLIK